MLTEQQRIILRQAIDLLHEADALMQDALGDTEECFDLHCGIESMADDLEEVLDRVETGQAPL